MAPNINSKNDRKIFVENRITLPNFKCFFEFCVVQLIDLAKNYG